MRKPCTSASDYLSKPQNEHRSAIHYVLNTHHNKSVGIGRSLYTDSPTSTISYLLPPFRCPDVYEIYLQKIECFTLVFQKRLFCDAKEPLLECKIEIMVFLWNYLYKTGVVLRRGKCRGCGVVSDGSTMAALPIVRHWQRWFGLLHRLDAVVRSVLLASVDVQRRHESAVQSKIRCFLISLSVVLS